MLKKILTSLLFSTAAGFASANSCSNAGLGAITDFCFDSAFPLRIMGSTVISGNDVPNPPHATNQSICKCGKEPYVRYGYTRGMWLPTRLVEVVRNPSCSPVYGKQVGQVLKQMSRVGGLTGAVSVNGGSVGQGKYDTGFYHYHSWVFPLYNIYGWTPRCFYRGSFESSVLQPTWSKRDPVWGNLLYPEWMAIGNVVNNPLFDMAAHTASCVANTTGVGWGYADDTAYWLGGCMGNNLPAVGALSAERDSTVATSTILNRSIMVSNRTGGFASVSTVGDNALCSPIATPFPRKSEFKATMLYPYSEASSGSSSRSADGLDLDTMVKQSAGEVASFLNITSRCAHRLGASSLRWGIGRSEKSTKTEDEDAVYLLWRWVDCCEFD